MTANDATITDPKPQPPWKLWKQRRHVLVFLVFFGYFNLSSLQVNMSVAIVAMTQDRFDTLENGTEINKGPELKWDNVVQGYVLSAFFYGYLFTQVLGGVLSRTFGGKFVFGFGVCSTALLTLVSPWLAELGPFYLIAGRALMGLLQGVTFSSLFTIWATWIPPSERSRATSRSNSGCYVGIVFGMVFYPYLDRVFGWRSIFWFSGGSGVLWCLAWYYLTAESPKTDPKISTSEFQYIQRSLHESQPIKSSGPVRWTAILTSTAAWALHLAMFCEAWGFTTLLTMLPKFFKDVYKFDLAQSGGLSALQYVAVAIMVQAAGQLADWLTGKRWLTITQIRKTFMATGFLCQSCFMMGAAFCSVIVGTVFCLVMALGMGAFAISCLSVNALDIAPLTSSVLIGITLTMGAVPGIVSPIIAGHVISTENPTAEQWRIVFYITAGLYLFGTIFYVIFGSGTRQPWDLDLDRDNTVSSRDS